MTELYVFGAILGVIVAALVAFLREAKVSWTRLAFAVFCTIVFAVVVFLLIMNAVVALCFAGIPIVFICMMMPDEVERKRLWWRIMGDKRADTTPEVIVEASIISSLEKKMDLVLACGGHAVIVGGDGYPLGVSEYPWRCYIQKLLKRGCKLTQYVVAPTDDAKKVFGELESYACGVSGEFHWRQLADPSTVVDENDRHLIRMLATYHPTLAWNDNGKRILWIESRHPANSTVAFGCKYYSPECLAADSKPFEDKKDMLNRAWAATEKATSCVEAGE